MSSAGLSPSAGESGSRSVPISPPDLYMLFPAKPVLSRIAIRNFDHQTDSYLLLQDLGRFVFTRQTPLSSELTDSVLPQL